MKGGLFIDEHMNNYSKLLTDLVNEDAAIEEEDKALILLNFLPDEEYETFILTLINGKQTLSYSEVSAALINYKVKRKDKQSSQWYISRGIKGKRQGFQSEGQTRAWEIKVEARFQRSEEEPMCLLQRVRALED